VFVNFKENYGAPMKNSLGFIILCFFVQFGQKVGADVKPAVRPQMQEFFVLTQEIHGYLVNKSEYLDAKNP
jgi:hypothetical protein